MKLIIEAFNLEHANYCIDNNIDAIILHTEKFGLRGNYDFSIEEIIKLNNNKKNTLIFIKANAFFFEKDLMELESFLKKMSSMNIDGLIFQDLAVATINEELNLNLKLRYNPETLVTSYGQIDLYKEANFNSITLSRELMIFEVEEIAQNKNGMSLEIQVQGYGFIMHSRWNLISNFEENYNIDLNVKNDDFLSIKENLRKVPNLIKEDHHGTHMFTGYQICAIQILEKLYKIGIDFIRVDIINYKYEEAIKITDIYNQALKKVKMNSYDENTKEKLYKDIYNIFNNISLGFLGTKKDILHLLKEEE